MREFASLSALRQIVFAANKAPNVHNTQPWKFVLRPGGLQLRLDSTRKLEVLDPDGRQMYLSCGAALGLARIQGRALGLELDIELLPSGQDLELLADVRVDRGGHPSAEEIALAAAIENRHTHRGEFEARPIPEKQIAQLRHLVEQAAPGVVAQPISGDKLIELEVALAAADAAQRRDPRYQEELARWSGLTHSSVGIPADALGWVAGSSLTQRDFGAEHQVRVDGSAPAAERPLVLAVISESDDAAAWLSSGMGLGTLLVAAAGHDIQGQPLGQVTDRIGDRIALGHKLGILGHVQLVLRMGYAPSVWGRPRRAPQEFVTLAE